MDGGQSVQMEYVVGNGRHIQSERQHEDYKCWEWRGCIEREAGCVHWEPSNVSTSVLHSRRVQDAMG